MTLAQILPSLEPTKTMLESMQGLPRLVQGSGGSRSSRFCFAQLSGSPDAKMRITPITFHISHPSDGWAKVRNAMDYSTKSHALGGVLSKWASTIVHKTHSTTFQVGLNKLKGLNTLKWPG